MCTKAKTDICMQTKAKTDKGKHADICMQTKACRQRQTYACRQRQTQEAEGKGKRRGTFTPAPTTTETAPLTTKAS